MQGLNYFRRIFKVYLTRDKGYLSFWHEKPAVSESMRRDDFGGPYYMTFEDKANYRGPSDSQGVILFDYYFDIGRQYNPLAVAQYGLGNWNLYLKTGNEKHFKTAKIQADWLVGHLEKEGRDIWVWKHHFKWHYKKNLASGWYSAHSQGTGISLLAKLYAKTKDKKYLEAAKKAFKVLDVRLEDGGVKYIDPDGGVWLEEYRITPPTHILNGYLWALWGVWDFYLMTKNERSKKLFGECIKTLKNNLHRYDLGFWSLYDLSEQFLKMIASSFYHKLHIVQLQATYLLTKERTFKEYSNKFDSYRRHRFNRTIALIYKTIFKLFYF